MSSRNMFTDEQLQEMFDKWCRGDIGAHTMTKKEYNTFKRRTARRGFKKTAKHFTVTTKVSPAEYREARRKYGQEWRKRQKERYEQQEVAEEAGSDAEELEEARQGLESGEYRTLV